MTAQSRVYLCTEEPVLAAGLAAIIGRSSDLALDFAGPDIASVVERCKMDPPAVVLFDFVPDEHMGFLFAMRGLPAECKVVLWVHSIPVEIAFQARKLGVRGILRRNLPEELIVKCLRKVAAGELWFDKELTNAFLDANAISLTKREGQLVALVARGLRNKEIAAELDISDATVRIYLSALFRKLGVKDRYELAIYGMKNMPAYVPGAESCPRAVPELRSMVISTAESVKATRLVQMARAAGAR
jgi:two-component system, NarL family, nitrate/nitrite response regulator NarL